MEGRKIQHNIYTHKKVLPTSEDIYLNKYTDLDIKSSPEIRGYVKSHPWKFTAGFMALALIYCAFFQFFYVWMRYGVINAYPTTLSIFTTYLMNLIPLSVIWLVTIVVVFMPNYRCNIGFRAILTFVICIFSLVVLNFTFQIITNENVDWAGTFFNTFLIYLICYAAYYEMIRRNDEKIKRETMKQLYEYQDKTFLNQFKPHFLFNSLNILYSMVSNASIEDTRKFIISLSNIYRYILDNMNTSVIELEKECSFLDDYIHILTLRYDSKLRVKFEGTVPANKYIVPFSLQLLVENIVKHNKITRSNPMDVSLVFKDTNIKVSNPIHAIDKKVADKESTKHGLMLIKNIYSRYGLSATVENDGEIFTVTLPYIDQNIHTL